MRSNVYLPVKLASVEMKIAINDWVRNTGEYLFGQIGRVTHLRETGVFVLIGDNEHYRPIEFLQLLSDEEAMLEILKTN
jgi:hypothetical protein